MSKTNSRLIDFDTLWFYTFQRTLDQEKTASIIKKCVIKNHNPKNPDLENFDISILKDINRLINICIRSQESTKFINNFKSISPSKAEKYISHIAIRDCTLMQQEFMCLYTYLELSPDEISKLCKIPKKKVLKELEYGRATIESKITNFAKIITRHS